MKRIVEKEEWEYYSGFQSSYVYPESTSYATRSDEWAVWYPLSKGQEIFQN